MDTRDVRARSGLVRTTCRLLGAVGLTASLLVTAQAPSIASTHPLQAGVGASGAGPQSKALVRQAALPMIRVPSYRHEYVVSGPTALPATEMMRLMQGRFDSVFPFQGCPPTIARGTRCDLRPRNLPFPVEVLLVSNTGWVFKTLRGHVLGPNATVGFTFRKTGDRSLSLEIFGAVPAANLLTPLAWEAYKRITEIEWKAFQRNLQTHLRARMAVPPIGTTVSLESVNFQGSFLRHRHGVAVMTPLRSALDHSDGHFVLVRGLTGTGFSLRSVNFPGHYLRHQHGRMRISPVASTALYRNDASFHVRPGLADSLGWSFESQNLPGRYVRHANGHFHVTDARVLAGTFAQDATLYFRR